MGRDHLHDLIGGRGGEGGGGGDASGRWWGKVSTVQGGARGRVKGASEQLDQRRMGQAKTRMEVGMEVLLGGRGR